MGQHDPQCICEICTCGRHQCPFDRAKSHNNSSSALSFGAEVPTKEEAAKDHFYRKEFATVADGMERTKAARPKGELSVEKTPFSIDDQHHQRQQRDNELRPALVADARHERFLTSAALKKRGQKSQIELGGGQQQTTAAPPAMRSTYREESERAMLMMQQQQNGNGGGGGVERTRPIQRAVSGHAAAELFSGGHPDTPKTSQHRIDYGAKQTTERAQPTRPKASELWKRDGPIQGTTTTREQFAQKSPGKRATPYRPQPTAASFLGGEPGADRHFQRESSSLSDYGPKKGERMEARRPPDSDLFKRDPAQLLVPATTVSQSEYKATTGQGERYALKRPDESHILRGQGPFDGSSVTRDEYSEKGAGERFPAKRPDTDELWHREGTMGEMGSVNRVEYTIEGKRGERYEMHKPPIEQQLFDPDIHPSLPLSTVHRTDFVQRQAERMPPRGVATASEGAELLRGDGTFMSETDNCAEFQPKKGDRFGAKVPGSSEIWKSADRMDHQTVNREAYGGRSGGAAERVEAKRPQESGILRGEGKFTSETHKRVEFGPKRGERAEAIRPTDSDMFKREGPIGQEGTVNRTDYSHTQGERAERRIPASALTTAGMFGVAAAGAEFAKQTTVSREEFGQKHSDPVQLHRPLQNLRLEGAQPSHGSVTREDFVAKHMEDGQQHPQRHSPSNWQHESSFGLLGGGGGGEEWIVRSMNQDEFAPKELDERVRPVVHHSELSIADPGATFHTSTMYGDQFQQVSPDAYANRHAVRPSTALKLEGTRELTSGYSMEYTNKIMPCPAGELIDSVKEDHVPTRNFEFHSVNKGHHLYRSRENLAAAASEET